MPLPMYALYKLLLVIHISAAAVTLGGSTGLLRHLRRACEAGGNTFLLAAQDALRRGKIMGITSFIVLWTGVSLIFVRGGFKAVPFQIHIALTIMIASIVVSATIMRPTSKQLVELAQAPELDKETVAKKLKKMAMGQGILHLNWLVMLLLMLFAN